MSVKLTELAEQRFVDNVTSITPGALKGGILAVATHPELDHIVVGGSDGVPKVYRIFREVKREIGDDAQLIARPREPQQHRASAFRRHKPPTLPQPADLRERFEDDRIEFLRADHECMFDDSVRQPRRRHADRVHPRRLVTDDRVAWPTHAKYGGNVTGR